MYPLVKLQYEQVSEAPEVPKLLSTLGWDCLGRDCTWQRANHIGNVSCHKLLHLAVDTSKLSITSSLFNLSTMCSALLCSLGIERLELRNRYLFRQKRCEKRVASVSIVKALDLTFYKGRHRNVFRDQTRHSWQERREHRGIESQLSQFLEVFAVENQLSIPTFRTGMRDLRDNLPWLRWFFFTMMQVKEDAILRSFNELHDAAATGEVNMLLDFQTREVGSSPCCSRCCSTICGGAWGWN